MCRYPESAVRRPRRGGKQASEMPIAALSPSTACTISNAGWIVSGSRRRFAAEQTVDADGGATGDTPEQESLRDIGVG
jgi:hypothetical protein